MTFGLRLDDTFQRMRMQFFTQIGATHNPQERGTQILCDNIPLLRCRKTPERCLSNCTMPTNDMDISISNNNMVLFSHIYQNKRFDDKRGFLREVFHKYIIKKNLIFSVTSSSKKNVLRGLHLQTKDAQAKIIVDIRFSVNGLSSEFLL